MIFRDSVSGMSVKIGHVINGEKTYVVGAPRSTEVGQVLLLQPEGEYLVVKLTLNGEQFGSGFGYDIALGDFNNDGLARHIYCQMYIIVDKLLLLAASRHYVHMNRIIFQQYSLSFYSDEVLSSLICHILQIFGCRIKFTVI